MINKGEAICKRLSNDLDLAGINYSKSKASLEKRRLLLQNSKQLVEEREAKIVLLKKMNENLESKLKNINGIAHLVGGNNSSENGAMKKRKEMSSSGSSSRKKKSRKASNNNNDDIGLSVGAHELFINGVAHATFLNSKWFVPLKDQTMIEASAYGGFELAIALCHLGGFGNFVKDKMKGLRMINEYVINNKNDHLVQNFRGDMKDWFTNDYNRYQWNVQCEFLNCKRNVYLQKCGILVFFIHLNPLWSCYQNQILNKI